MALISSFISWYFKKRWPDLEHSMLHPADVQMDTLNGLIRQAKATEWGQKYDYTSIASYDQFKNRFPVSDYEFFKPYIERTMGGEQNLLWPSNIQWFAKSSGTTSEKSKFIPVSFESLEQCHFHGSRDVLTLYCNNNQDTDVFNGKGLVIGGSHSVNAYSENSYFGDLSAVLMSNTPFWVDFLRTPDKSIALLAEWEEKLEKMANATVNEDVTNISGVPTWTIVLIEKLFELSGKKDLKEIWPNLEVYIHGGVSFVPYRERFSQLIPKGGVKYMETYNASEGFFGIQDDPARDDMLLMTDYGIFYEFVKRDEIWDENPNACPLWEVEPGIEYAVVISTNAGLWRYILGDTVRFTSTSPYRFKITGRTKLFINAFGEELVIDNAEKAISAACSESGAIVADYTAAPRYMEEGGDAGHEWLIEFVKEPESIEQFRYVLDNTLKALNSDYEAKRYKDIAIQAPKVVTLPRGLFRVWLREKGKLGGQHKVPRLSNDRIIVDEILQIHRSGSPAVS